MSKSARQSVETDLLLGMEDVPLAKLESQTESLSADARIAPTVVVAGASVTESARLSRSNPISGIPTSDSGAQLDELRMRHDRECLHCTTVRGHTHTVFGEGSPSAKIFFVGEAPGETEDLTGRPFVGRAGQKLDEMIAAMGLRREDCYIANVLKSRPPDNRVPLPSEISLCSPFLVEQILIVSPVILVPLGGPATKLLLKVDLGISKLRGIWTQWVPPAASGRAPIAVMPTFHPAYLLRNYTAETRAAVWSDLKAVMNRLAQS
ncbi:MAG: uracil-DNA glycosylase [Phycisphaerales bacterium]|nr:uracil-DNA glycosylase [Phycisphaerales bacterium]